MVNRPDINGKITPVAMQLLSEGTVSVRKTLIDGYELGEAYFVPNLGRDYKYNGEKLLDVLFGEDEVEWFYTLLFSKGGAIFLESIEDLGRPAPYRVENEQLAESKAPKVNYKFIDYKIDYNCKTLKKLFADMDMDEYLQSNYKEDSCVYTTVIDAYRQSFIKAKQQGRYVNVDLTYEYLWNLIHPDVQFDKDAAMKESIENLSVFFKKYSLKLVCLDRFYKVIYKYIPEKVNKKINPRVLYLLIHNNHCYRLNHNLKSLEQMVHNMSTEEKDEKLTRKFMFASSPTDFTFLDDINKLNLIALRENDEKKVITVYYNASLKALLQFFLFEAKYIPTISYSAGQISQIIVQVHDVMVKIINPGKSDYESDVYFENEKYFQKYSDLERELYQSLLNKNTISTYNREFLETLNKYPRSPLVCAFENMPLDRVSGIPTIETIACDVIKAYTSNLLDMKYIPVFNSFDNFTQYNNEKLEDYTLYFVEYTGTSKEYFIMFDKRYCLCYGFILTHVMCDQIKIHYFATPSRLVKNSSPSIINKIYASDLEIGHKKFIVNKIIGLTGKKYACRQKSSIFMNFNEAMYYQEKYPNSRIHSIRPPDQYVEVTETDDIDGEIVTRIVPMKSTTTTKYLCYRGIPILTEKNGSLDINDEIPWNLTESKKESVFDSDRLYDWDRIIDMPLSEMEKHRRVINKPYFVEKSVASEKGYILVDTKKKDLENGFLPIQLFIYDVMRLKMFMMYKELQSKGATVVAIKTDSLFLDASTMKQLPKNPDSNKFESIGKYRFEKGNLCPGVIKKFEENKIDIVHNSDFSQKDIIINDEWDQTEFNKIFKKETGIIVKAIVPGAGKTHSLREFARTFGIHKVLFVVPYNTLCLEFRDQGFQACTHYTLLSLRINDNGEDEGTGTSFDVSQFKVIVFDEIYCHTVHNLARIREFMTKYESIQYFATGDVDQLPPIETLNVSDTKKYYNNILAVLFPKSITLKICKRVKTEEERQRLLDLKKDIFENGLDATDVAKKYFKVISNLNHARGKMIAYRNKTVNAINRYCHDKQETPAKFVTHNEIKYYPGVQLRCRKFFLKDSVKFRINYIYEITKISKTDVSVMDIDTKKEIALPLDYLSKFTLNYAYTGHSFQGITVNELSIFNISFPMITNEWLWTTFTRCSDLNKVRVFIDDKLSDKNLVIHALQRKIEGHRLEDTKKNRPFDESDYIDRTYVCQLFRSQQCQCARCDHELDVDYDNDGQAQFSINRIDNNLAHIKSNCELVCLQCQHGYK